MATKPAGRLLISTAAGKPVASQRFRLATFLPGTSIEDPVLLPQRVLAPGRHRARVDLSYSAEELGYRRRPSTVQTVGATSAFTVTSRQYRSIFNGATPLAPHAKHAAGGSTLVVLLAGALAALAVLSVVLVLGVRLWPRR